MSEASKAVFLSYASQDAEAAKKICDALRAVGVEVWFDQNELVGGDAWDAKIRGQIGSCALFVPIISANTQARDEGYFRLEWKLAVDRSHLMVHDKAFLLPIVIDATGDAAARVPPEFRAVQWTRLPGGETPEKFCARVKHLLGGEVAPVSDRRFKPDPTNNAGRRPALPLNVPARSWSVPAIIGVALIIAGAAYFALRPRRGPEEIAKVLASAQTIAADAVAKPAPVALLSEARQLVAKARAIALHDQWDEATREDFALAEQLLKRATDLDPTDGEAWAAAALCSCGQIAFRYDTSPARREAARNQAARARSLAPNSNQALFAVAYSYRYQQNATKAESLRLQRLVVERAPDDKFIVRQLGRILDPSGDAGYQLSTGDPDECLIYYDRAAALPGGDPTALRFRADYLFDAGRYAEAEAAIDRALVLRPAAGHLYVSKIVYSMSLRHDLAEAQRLVARIPATYLLDDLGAYSASSVWLASREPERCLAVLNGLNHDYLDCRFFAGPKAVLTAQAQEMAGRHDAALADWRIALQKIELRLTTEPEATNWLGWKALVLAQLGERDAAEAALHLYEQRMRFAPGRVLAATWPMHVALGRSDAVIDYFVERLQSDHTPRFVAELRRNPALDPLRANPRFVQLLGEAESALAVSESKTSSAVAPGEKSAPSDKSVAVLAFADLSAAHDSEYFSDGISEELINALGKVPGLKVPARTSSFHFKGKDTPVPEIAQQLGVAYVIEGSVQRVGDKVKIGARLTKAADGFQVWSDSFMRDAKDVFAVEEEIAGLIAKNLSLKLGASSSAATASVNPQAFELYLQGRQAWNRRTSEGYAAAEACFARAIALDPNFARAYVGQADVLDVRGWDDGSVGPWDQRNSETLKKIHGLLERAIALAPDLAEAYASLGGADYDGWNYPAALREARQAVQLNSNYATGWHWLGEMQWDRGEMEEALADLHRAADLDPFSPAIAAANSLCLRDAGRTREALAAAERAVNLQPGSPRALGAQALALLDLGRKSAAVPIARELLNSEDGRDWWQTGTIVVRAGLPDEAGKLLEQYRKPGRERLAAPLFALLGRGDEFLAVWQTRPMMTNQPWYLWEPSLDSLRGNPDFLRVLDQVGLTEAHARVQAWRAAHPPETGGQRTDNGGRKK